MTRKNDSGPHDPYADQLAAARYRAERDQARQELERERHRRKLAERAEDHEAAAWVREHGGIEALRRMFQDADNRRVELCGALGIDLDKGWSEAMAAMRLRLMPEGMEWLLEVWPKWSNGEYCKFGDWWTADKYGDYEPKQLRRLAFYTPDQLREWEQDEGDNFGYEWDFMRPSDTTYRPDKAEPPAPKVLDADGAEIRVGDEMWDVDGSGPFIVSGFVGEPLAVIFEIAECNDLPRKPSQLTHERPVADTWERLEEDVREILGDGLHPNDERALDLLSRAKALAERDAK